MREVTREEFHASVGKMNVHPRPEIDASYYETPYRQIMGKTTPGYKPPQDWYKNGCSVRYFVVEK